MAIDTHGGWVSTEHPLKDNEREEVMKRLSTYANNVLTSAHKTPIGEIEYTFNKLAPVLIWCINPYQHWYKYKVLNQYTEQDRDYTDIKVIQNGR